MLKLFATSAAVFAALVLPSRIVVAAAVTTVASSNAYQGSANPELIPFPQEMSFAQGILPLDGLSVVKIGDAVELARAERDLRAELRMRLGGEFAVNGSRQIRIGTFADPGLATEARARRLELSVPEGYALWVDEQGATIVGVDAIGAYRGAQTLRQLLSESGFRFVTVRDWPRFAVRAAMIYLDTYSKGVNDILIPILAKLKYSHVLVSSNYVRWDSTKNIHHPMGATKDEAKRVAALIRDYGMEPIPYIELLGHSQWLFYNNQNRDIAQDPTSREPYSYDTLNSRSYEVILPILDEAIDVFHPRLFHIGHDEITGRDRFPGRENGQALGLERLFADDVVTLHDHLKAANVRTMIWHDVALSPSYREKILPALPRDLIFVNWHYDPSDDYPSVREAQQAGFEVIGASWFEPGNAIAFARSAARDGALGMLQTRWSGYFGNPSVFDGQSEQGVAYVAAGSAFWNPAAKSPSEYIQALQYRDGYRPRRFGLISGQLVDLAGLANRALIDADGTGWIGKGPSADLSSLPKGRVRLGAYEFLVSNAVMLKGARPAAQNLPTDALIEFVPNTRAKALAFLHTTGWISNTNRERIGSYTIEYADGSSLTQVLEYGRHITAWVDTVVHSLVYDTPWQGQTADGLSVALNLLLWRNPKPELEIRSVRLTSAGLQANPTLIGMTLLDASPEGGS